MSNISNKDFRLQLLHCDQLFESPKAAKKYIIEKFEPWALQGEPAVAFYGDPKHPRPIFAIGMGNEKISFVDPEYLAESIDKIKHSRDEHSLKVHLALTEIQNIVNAIGLSINKKNKTEFQFEYKPANSKGVLGDAHTISQALDILAEYAEQRDLKTSDTDTIRMSYKDDKGGGKVLKAAVNISNEGSNDNRNDNDNIIGVKADGIYAASSLEYDEPNQTLIYKTSGMENGMFKNDIVRNEIKLGKHTEIVEKNNDNNPVKIKIKQGEDSKEISAKLKVSEDNTNILTVKDGTLFVEGTSSNIKHNDNETVNTVIERLINENEDLDNNIKDVKQQLDNAYADVVAQIGTVNNNLNESLKDTNDNLTNEINKVQSNLNLVNDKIRHDVDDIVKENNNVIENKLNEVRNSITEETNRATQSENELTHKVDENYKELSRKDDEIYNELTNKNDSVYKELSDKNTEIYSKLSGKDDEIYKELSRKDDEIYNELTRKNEENYNKLSSKDEENYNELTRKVDENYNKLSGKDEENYKDLNNQIGSIKIEKIDDLKYQLSVNGKLLGDIIDIPRDQFLKHAWYEPQNKKIIFLVVNNEGIEERIEIDAADLVNIYEAGEGILLKDDNKITLNLNSDDSTTSKILTVGKNGLTVKEELATKEYVDETYAKIGDAYTTIESDGKYATKSDIEGMATQSWVEDKGYLEKSKIFIDEPNNGSIRIHLDNQEYDVLTEHQNLGEYAKTAKVVAKEDVVFTHNPSNGTVNISVDGKSADVLTKHQSLDAYAKSADVDATFVKKSEISIDEPNNDSVTIHLDKQECTVLTKHQDLGGYATKDEVKGTYATKQDIADMASKTWVENKKYLTEHQSLDAYAKSADVVTKKDYDKEKENFARKTEVVSKDAYNNDKENFATKTWVGNQNYLTQQNLNDYAKTAEVKEWVENKNYLNKDEVYFDKQSEDVVTIHLEGEKKLQQVLTPKSLEKYALKDGNATQDWVKDKNYLTPQSLNGYATQEWVTINVSLIKASNSDTYTLYVNGRNNGSINIPKEQFLKDARYDSINKKIVFTFKTDTGEEKTLEIDAHDLINIYKAGNGIIINTDENLISFNLNDDSITSKYLKVTNNGLTVKQNLATLDDIDSIKGILGNLTNDQLNSLLEAVEKLQGMNFATETWVENKKYLTEHQSLDAYAKSADVVAKSSVAFIQNPSNGTVNISVDGKSADVLTKHQSLDAYATQDWVKQNYSSKDNDGNTELSAKDITADSVTNKGTKTNVQAALTELADAISDVTSNALGIKAGDGITLSSGNPQKISVNIREGETCLKVSEDGLYTEGISDIITKIGDWKGVKNISETLNEINTSITNLTQTVNELIKLVGKDKKDNEGEDSLITQITNIKSVTDNLIDFGEYDG